MCVGSVLMSGDIRVAQRIRVSETRLARQEASSASCGCEAAATCHDSCTLVSDKRGSATILSPSGPVSER